MKLLFTRLIILSCLWMTLGSAMPIVKKSLPAAKQTFYYWYWTDTDTYLEYSTTATAINDLEFMTAKLVNTQNIGGTLVANGYNNNNYPHTLPAALQLYTH